MPDAACCIGCRPDPAQTIEIVATPDLPGGPARIALRGQLRRLADDDPTGWRWQIRGAVAHALGVPSPFLSRRAVLAAPLACAIVAPACAQPVSPQAHAVLAAATPVDLHSHAGRVILRRGPTQRPFEPVAAPMRAGGMRLIALCIVPDTPDKHPKRIDELDFAAVDNKAAKAKIQERRREVEATYLRMKFEFDAPIRGTPCVADGVLYLATENTLYAFKKE